MAPSAIQDPFCLAKSLVVKTLVKTNVSTNLRIVVFVNHVMAASASFASTTKSFKLTLEAVRTRNQPTSSANFVKNSLRESGTAKIELAFSLVFASAC